MHGLFMLIARRMFCLVGNQSFLGVFFACSGVKLRYFYQPRSGMVLGWVGILLFLFLFWGRLGLGLTFLIFRIFKVFRIFKILKVFIVFIVQNLFEVFKTFKNVIFLCFDLLNEFFSKGTFTNQWGNQ